MSLGLQGLVGVVVDHVGNALVCTVDNHLQTIYLSMYLSEGDHLCGTRKTKDLELYLEVLQSQRAWLRGLPFNNNLLFSEHQERLNPLSNITSDTIFTLFA